MENGHKIFGSKVAPKTSITIHSTELGKPCAFPWVGVLQEITMMQRAKDMEKSEWQSVINSIEAHALTRKDANFPLVFHCMNRDKPGNMRKSITPNGDAHKHKNVTVL